MARNIDDDWNSEDDVELPDNAWFDQQLEVAIQPDEDRPAWNPDNDDEPDLDFY